MRTAHRRLIGASLIFALPSMGSATIYFVKEGGTGVNGLSWSDAFGTLEEAFAVAIAGDDILVQEGTYVPRDSGTGRNRTFSPPAGVAIRGGYVSSTDPDTPDGSFVETILSGDIGTQGVDTDNCYNVVTLDSLGHTANDQVTIDGFKITGGYADGSGCLCLIESLRMNFPR